MSNLYTGHWAVHIVRNPETDARLDEEARLRAQVRDMELAVSDDVRREAAETYYDAYASLTTRGVAPLDAMIAASRSRLTALKRGDSARTHRERAWRAFTRVYPRLSTDWWHMAAFWARLEEPATFWRNLADELEAAAEQAAHDAEDADWQEAMRERADLLAGL